MRWENSDAGSSGETTSSQLGELECMIHRAVSSARITNTVIQDDQGIEGWKCLAALPALTAIGTDLEFGEAALRKQ